METTTVREVMTENVVSAREDTPFKELVRMMAQRQVSGVPIVDGNSRLLGIATEADLLRAGEHEEPPRSLVLEWFIDRKRLEEIEWLGEDIRARDIMTRDVFTVTPDTSVHEAAQTLLRAEVKRLPVVDEEGKVVGIVSRRDLLRPFLRGDEEIRREIEQGVIFKTMWIAPGELGVTVRGGVVTLEGTVDLKSTRDILVELARRVSGVVGVEDRLRHERDDRKIGTGPLARPDPGLVREQR